jgi:hypothetical protein
MILDIELKKLGDRISSEKSTYNPGKEVTDITQMVMNHFDVGYQIMNSPYNEFNGLNLLMRQEADQKKWNNFRPDRDTDPDTSWKSNAIRPITRNKVISIAAHLTSRLLYPKVIAQNDQDEEDKDAAYVMELMIRWALEQSDYERTFLNAVIAALVNPAVIIHEEFQEVVRTVKEKLENGKYKTTKVLDELYSGFQQNLIPCNELYIGNIYENNIQKQPFLIRRKVMDFSEACGKYGGNKNFDTYVKAGIQIMMNAKNYEFYEEYDDELGDRLVEEITYYNRSLDLQLVFVNGVLLDNPEECNPRLDKKYPFVKTGFEPIDEGKFFYYFSLVRKMSPDSEIIDRMYNMVIDGTFLELMPPMALFGDDTVDSSIVMPGMVTSFNSDTKLQPIRNGSNLTAGMNMLNKMEDSVSESSQAPRQMGQEGSGQKTAYEISQLEKNAKIGLGLAGRMIGFLVRDLGQLVVSDAIQYLTVGQVAELTTGDTMLKYRKFLLNGVDNEEFNEAEIQLDNDLPEEMSEEEDIQNGFKIMDEEGGIDSKKAIFKVNPTIFRNLKYKTYITAEMIEEPSDNVKRALNLEVYDRAIANPSIDSEAITKDLLLGSYPETKDRTDKYMRKPEDMESMMMQQQAGARPNNVVGSVANAERQVI